VALFASGIFWLMVLFFVERAWHRSRLPGALPIAVIVLTLSALTLFSVRGRRRLEADRQPDGHAWPELNGPGSASWLISTAATACVWSGHEPLPGAVAAAGGASGDDRRPRDRRQAGRRVRRQPGGADTERPLDRATRPSGYEVGIAGEYVLITLRDLPLADEGIYRFELSLDGGMPVTLDIPVFLVSTPRHSQIH